MTVADPATSGAGCDPSSHGAVWTASLTNAKGSFSFPIFVHALADQATVLHWCLSRDAPQLNELMVDLSGVFTRPVRGDVLWDGRFTPYDPATGAVIDGEQVSALALVRLPQVVALHVTYSHQSHRYVAAGTVTENGQPVQGRVLVSRSLGSGSFRSSRAGLTHTDAAGRFQIAGRLSANQAVRFRAHAWADRRDISKPSCGKDINNVRCVHESLALWEKDSNVVSIRPWQPPRDRPPDPGAQRNGAKRRVRSDCERTLRNPRANRAGRRRTSGATGSSNHEVLEHDRLVRWAVRLVFARGVQKLDRHAAASSYS